MSSLSSCCSAFLRWIPCVFIIAIIFWSYYAYVVELCVYIIVENSVKQGFYLLFYHIFCLMFIWSYWQTIFTDVMVPSSDYSIPKEYQSQVYKPESEENRQAALKEIIASRNLTVVTRTIDGGIRYCEITKRIKPDRCHYCSVVQKCVLKMDHYCPWVNNCVGFSNYKFFLLFLFYGFTYCLYVSATVLEYFIEFWQNLPDGDGTPRFHILFLFFASVMFAISLIGLLGYHLFLIYKNRSTLESFRTNIFSYGSDENGYNLGGKKNFDQVFGERKLLWVLPLFTSMGDGMSYPTRLITQDSERNSGNGMHFPQQSRQVDDDGFGESSSRSSSQVAILMET